MVQRTTLPGITYSNYILLTPVLKLGLQDKFKMPNRISYRICNFFFLHLDLYNLELLYLNNNKMYTVYCIIGESPEKVYLDYIWNYQSEMFFIRSSPLPLTRWLFIKNCSSCAAFISGTESRLFNHIHKSLTILSFLNIWTFCFPDCQ